MPVQPSLRAINKLTPAKRPLLVVRSLSYSAVTFSGRGPGPKPRRIDIPSVDGTRELDSIEIIHFRAVEDLQHLILHVKALVQDQRAIAKQVDEWLDKLLEAAADLQRWLLEKKLYSTRASSDTPEEIDDLVYFCNEGKVSVEDLFIDIECETQKDLLLTRLMEYWIEEVQSRAFAVHGIFIKSADVYDAQSTLSGLDAMRYPM